MILIEDKLMILLIRRVQDTLILATFICWLLSEYLPQASLFANYW